VSITEHHEIVAKLKALSIELGKTPTLRELEQSGVSKRQIQKHKFSELVKAAGLEPNKHAQTTVPVEPVTRPPVICYLDIETSHMEVKVYSLKNNDYISHRNIKKVWHLYSYAATLEHEPERFYYLDQRFEPNIENDRPIIEAMHHIISNSDILSGHNLKRFDLKKFNTRAALYELDPIPEKIIWDTLPMFRKHFDLPSYSLGYIAKYFNFKNQKLDHSGDMWDRCEAGELEAWQENEKYNKMDVLCQREALHFIAKFDPSINIQAFHYSPVCICGTTKFFKDGFKYTRQGKFQVRRCSNKSCGKTFVEKNNQIDKDLRSNFYK
jgi:DNA polymerase elongation subunit (family B)